MAEETNELQSPPRPSTGISPSKCWYLLNLHALLDRRCPGGLNVGHDVLQAPHAGHSTMPVPWAIEHADQGRVLSAARRACGR
jgi:hypothetical protein